MSDTEKIELLYTIRDANSGLKWWVLMTVFGKVFSRVKKYDDSINFAAYSCYPEGVVKPYRDLNPSYIHFQWWGRSLANFGRDFQERPALFDHLMDDTLKCMAELHRQGITHRNLRKENIFYFESKFKIAYFEKGSRIKSIDPAVSNSSQNLISEIDQNKLTEDKKEDVWKLGLILLECKNPNFQNSWLSNFNEHFQHLDEQIRNIFGEMLRDNPLDRCSMEKALRDWQSTMIAVQVDKSLNQRTA